MHVYDITPQHLNWLEWASGVSGDPDRGTLEGRYINVPITGIVAAGN